jgi:hypothetical protein
MIVNNWVILTHKYSNRYGIKSRQNVPIGVRTDNKPEWC